jgi:hypothetical protein
MGAVRRKVGRVETGDDLEADEVETCASAEEPVDRFPGVGVEAYG